MDSIYDIIAEVNRNLVDITDSMQLVKAEDVGLDARCNKLYVNEDCIITKKHLDGALQYYGGFEYIDKSNRCEIGNFVIYFGEDDRVRKHIDRYYNKEDNDG